MILFHAKRDGTVTTTPELVPHGSSMQDLVVVSEFDYAYCAIRLTPASGEYIEDIPCNPILQSDRKTLWTASLPPEATVVAGSCGYQLIFTAADGTTQTTLAGSFMVPRGVPVSTPASVGELSEKTITDLYQIIENIYVLFTGHEGNIAKNVNDIANLQKLTSTGGTVTIPASEWTDGSPTMASISVSGAANGSVVLLLPANETTRLAAVSARLSAYPTVFTSVGGAGSVSIIRAEAEYVPDKDMTFTYLVLKTGIEEKLPVAAIVGVDAFGEGGGGSGEGGVDSAAVEVIVKRLVPEWARQEEPPEESDPTVPDWAKAAKKPAYDKYDVGLSNVDNVRQYSADNPPPYPVTSVNGKTGAVSLTIPSKASDVGADPAGTASSKLTTHNVDAASHQDIRLMIKEHEEAVNALLNSDDETLNETKEIVAYIKSNKSLIDAITTSKVNVSDIINDLTTNVTNKPLSAAQGVALKALIDGLQSGKLNATDLTSAINTALAQAKASGEFDGKDGKSAYEYAQDGGYEGTEEEFAEKLAQGQPVVVVTKTEFSALTEGDIADLYRKGGRVLMVEDGYTNLVPTAIGENGEIYYGCGYLNYYRLTSSGELSLSDGSCVSGYIPYSNNAIFRVVGSSQVVDAGGQYVAAYDSDFNLISVAYVSALVRGGSSTYKSRVEGVYELTMDTSKIPAWTNAAYFRVSCASCVGADLIVTKDEVIGLGV